jgi:hypothetical protein
MVKSWQLQEHTYMEMHNKWLFNYALSAADNTGLQCCKLLDRKPNITKIRRINFQKLKESTKTNIHIK